MKTLTTTIELRAYSEEEAKGYIEQFRNEAAQKGYKVKSAGWTRRTKKKKQVEVAEAWIVKCVAVYDDVWDEGEGEKQ